MFTRQVWITGAAFAFTTALIYVVCAVAVLLYPDAVLQLANTWAHGLDLTLVRRSPGNPLGFGAWAAGMATSAGFAFLVGVAYRWSLQVLARLGAPHRAASRATSAGT
jgi:hypothetical protein